MQQFPLRVSQGTVAAFYRCGEQGHNFLCQFFQDSVYQKLLKPVHFGQSYQKIINKNVIAFLKDGVHASAIHMSLVKTSQLKL